MEKKIMQNNFFDKAEDAAKKYVKKNVGQCWHCKFRKSDAVFKEDDNGEIKFWRIPECGKHNCYMTEILIEKCPDFIHK